MMGKKIEAFIVGNLIESTQDSKGTRLWGIGFL